VRWTFVRFTVVGLGNTCAYFAVFLPLAHVMPYFLAHVIGLLCSTTVGFLLHSHVTFRTTPTWRKAALFPLATATNLSAHTLGLVIGVEALGLSGALASVIAAAAALPITFVATRLVLVGRRPSSRSILTGPEPPR
jgi:putative flippase GtrA